MQPYVMAYIWIGIAAFLTAVEIATVQLVSVWFVLGALCAALTTIFTDSIVIQIVVFVSVSLVTRGTGQGDGQGVERQNRQSAAASRRHRPGARYRGRQADC